MVWDEDDDHGIDLVAGEQGTEAAAVLVGPSRSDHVDRIPEGGFLGESLGESLLEFCGEHRHLETLRLECIDGENGGPAGIGQHRNTTSLWQRLVGEERGDLERLCKVSVRITPD